MIRSHIVAKEGDQMAVHNVAEPRHEGIHGGVPGDPGRIGEDFLSPDKPRVLAEVDNPFEEVAEDREPEALADPGDARGVRQCLVKGVAEIPAAAEAVHRQRQEFSLRANAFEEHHQIELEDHNRIDGRTIPAGIGSPGDSRTKPRSSRSSRCREMWSGGTRRSRAVTTGRSRLRDWAGPSMGVLHSHEAMTNSRAELSPPGRPASHCHRDIAFCKTLDRFSDTCR